MIRSRRTKEEQLKLNNELYPFEKVEDETIYTCYWCSINNTCEHAWDLYNINGDCLMER